MKRNIITLLVIAVLSVSVVSFAYSQPMRGMHGAKGPMMGKAPGCCDDLKLSDEQRSQITDLKLKHEKEVLPLRSELHGKMVELKLLQTDDNPNLKKIDKKIDEIAELKAKIQKVNVRHRLQVRELLTPEQQKIFDAKLLKIRGHQPFGMKHHGKKGPMGEAPGFCR